MLHSVFYIGLLSHLIDRHGMLTVCGHLYGYHSLQQMRSYSLFTMCVFFTHFQHKLLDWKMHQTINPLGGVMISNSNEMSRINILLNLKTLSFISSSVLLLSFLYVSSGILVSASEKKILQETSNCINRWTESIKHTQIVSLTHLFPSIRVISSLKRPGTAVMEWRGGHGLAPETAHLSVGVSNSANPSWTFLMNGHHLHDHNRPSIVEGGSSSIFYDTFGTELRLLN